MSDIWYYAEGQKTVGPLTLAELTAILSRVSNPMDVLVWQSGASGWEKAQNVKELVAYLISPPPLPILDANLNTQPSEIKTEKPSVTFWVVIWACVGLFMIGLCAVLDEQTGWSQRRLEEFGIRLHLTNKNLGAKQVEIDQRVDRDCKELRERWKSIAREGVAMDEREAIDVTAEKGCVEFYARTI